MYLPSEFPPLHEELNRFLEPNVWDLFLFNGDKALNKSDFLGVSCLGDSDVIDDL